MEIVCFPLWINGRVLIAFKPPPELPLDLLNLWVLKDLWREMVHFLSKWLGPHFEFVLQNEFNNTVLWILWTSGSSRIYGGRSSMFYPNWLMHILVLVVSSGIDEGDLLVFYPKWLVNRKRPTCLTHLPQWGWLIWVSESLTSQELYFYFKLGVLH